MSKGARRAGGVGLDGRTCQGVIATAALVVALACAGCKLERGTTPPPGTSSRSTTDAATGETAAGGRKRATYEPGKPGPAYFAVRDAGVVMLDAAELTLVEGGPVEGVRDIARGADGGMYLLGAEGVMRLDGAELELVAATGDDTGALEGFAVAKDGTIWGVGDRGVSRWDGKAWATEPKAVLGPDVARIHGLVVDGRGRVWVATDHAIHLREAARWVAADVAKPLGGRPDFDGMALGPGGVALAITTDRLVRLHAPGQLEVEEVGAGNSFFGKLGSSATGVVGLRTSPDAVTRVAPDGAQTHWSTRKDFAASIIEDVAPDDAGRLWLATDVGVAILGPGPEAVEWRSGSVAELVGRVDAVGVAGAGPVLPSAVGPVKKASLAGRIVRKGKGLAKTTVEICPNPSVLFTRTPCANAPTRFSARTGADGRFTIADVPLGAYGMAIEVGKRWQLGEPAQHRMTKEGEVHDLGDLMVEEEVR